MTLISSGMPPLSLPPMPSTSSYRQPEAHEHMTTFSYLFQRNNEQRLTIMTSRLLSVPLLDMAWLSTTSFTCSSMAFFDRASEAFSSSTYQQPEAREEQMNTFSNLFQRKNEHRLTS
jgi:hypothetical protein